MTHDEGIDPHGSEGLDRVSEALALVHAGGADGERHRVGAQPLRCRVEAHSGAGGVLEEQVAHRPAPQGRHLRIRASTHLGHVVGEIEQTFEGGAVEVADPAKVPSGVHHWSTVVSGSMMTTPSTVTSTDSMMLVGRFFPTKSGRMGSSRCPRSTITASWTALGRP